MNIRSNDTVLHIIILIFDLVGMVLSVYIAFIWRYGRTDIEVDDIGIGMIISVFFIVTIVVSIVFSPEDHFITRGILQEFKDVLLRQGMTLLIVVLTLYLFHVASALSRLVFLYCFIASVLIVWTLRICLKKIFLKMHKKIGYTQKIVIIVDDKRINTIMEDFNSSNEWNKVISKIFVSGENNYDDIVNYVLYNEVEEVIISVSDWTMQNKYDMFVSKLFQMGVKVDFDIRQMSMDFSGNIKLDSVGQYSVVSVERNVLRLSQKVLKRTVDIVFGVVGTLIFLILFIALGPVIKLDSSGPVVFVQKRVGKNGRIFDFYKFRSMVNDADERKKELLDNNEMTGYMFKMEDDPRITRVGKFLRKTSLDEFPQFWNVLKGDMSLIGTRPPTVDEFAKYEPWHKYRLSMKPGITGLWQVSGRSDIKDFEEIVRLDAQYIDNWSVWEDIKIVFKTFLVVISEKGSK